MLRIVLHVALGIAAVVQLTTSAASADLPDWSAARRDDQGIITHEWRSTLQSAPTQVRVLQPERLDPNRRYPVVYVLPVEAGTEQRYGDGLAEVKKHKLADKYDAIFVAPTFAALPWYADHPTDPELRQESYFVEQVVTAVEARYPARAERDSRLLLGFSKSGWGAWTLLLRHPRHFGRAVAWDAPVMEDRPAKYGMGSIFGTQENFERYQITRLLTERAKDLRDEPAERLILLGHGNFRTQHEQMRARLLETRTPHWYIDGPQRKHDWHSGWVPEAAAALFGNPTR